MVLRAIPSLRSRDTITGFTFTTKGALLVITAVTSNPNFPCSFYFPPFTPLIFTGCTP